MGRPRTTTFATVAMSIDAAALAIKVPRRVVVEAIKSAELPAYQGPGKRIQVTVADLVAWVETWPRVQIKRRMS